MLEVARFRPRPVPVDAVRVGDILSAKGKDWRLLPAWIMEAYARGPLRFWTSGVQIKTLDGEMYGGPDDWVIRDAEGDVRPCRRAAFEAMYEPTEA